MQECPTCGQRINAQLAICPYCGATSSSPKDSLPAPSAADRVMRRDDPGPAARGRLFDPIALARRPAGFGMRLVAETIDFLALAVLGAALSLLTVFLQSTAGGKGLAGDLVAILSSVGWFGFGAYNAIYLPGTRGSSIGKHLCGIAIVNDQGGFIGVGGALARQLLKVFSALPCMLGFLWVLWDPQRQAWHDKIMRTFVYYD